MGVILAWSLVHGGPGGNFLSPTVYHAIAHGVDFTKPDLNDIHDDQLSDSLSKVILKKCCTTTISKYLRKVPHVTRKSVNLEKRYDRPWIKSFAYKRKKKGEREGEKESNRNYYYNYRLPTIAIIAI